MRSATRTRTSSTAIVNGFSLPHSNLQKAGHKILWYSTIIQLRTHSSAALRGAGMARMNWL